MDNPIKEDMEPTIRADLGTADDFRKRIRAKLMARGVSGPQLEQQVDELMSRDLGFRFNPVADTR